MLSTSVICIIDDDEAIRMSLESFLRATGTPVRTFDSAESFLHAGAHDLASCVITDLHMPGMDGLALQRELSRRGRRYPLIVMTAFPTEEARKESERLGASAFLIKPIDPDALLERMEELLS